MGPRLLMAGIGIVLVALTAAGLFLWQAGVQSSDLAALGYPGVFLVMLLSGGSVFFPAGGQVVILAAGALWNPVLVGMTAGVGNATGEFTGYFAGRAGEAMLEGRGLPSWWFSLRERLSRYGFFAILALALIPNPVFDVVGFLAGSVCYSARRFWLACVLGNSVKYTVLAHLGDATRLWVG